MMEPLIQHKKKRLEIVIFTIGLLIINPTIYSQELLNNRRIDSLQIALKESTAQNRYDILDKLAYEYLTVIDSIALQYATEAFNMSWLFGDSSRIVKSGRIKAMAYYGLQKHDSTIVISKLILPIARRNNYTIELKYILNLLAVAYTYKAEFDKALTYNFESLEVRKKSGDDFSVSIALNNIGLVYYKIDDFAQALNYFKKSMELEGTHLDRLRDVDPEYYANSLLNISLCYSYMNDIVKAEAYLDKLDRYCLDGCSDHFLMAKYFASGLTQFSKGSVDTASRLFSKSFSLAKEFSDLRYQLDNLIYLSKISLASHDLTKAEKYLLQAEPLFESDIPFRAELAEVYSQLGKVYFGMDNYRQAALYQTKYIDLSAKVFNQRLTVNLMKVQAEYLERENRAKLESQEKILLLNNDIINRQRALNIFVGVVAILSISFALVLIKNIKHKSRINWLLEEKVRERTVELRDKHELLLKSVKERDIQVERISNEIRSSLATIKGLGVLVSHDLSNGNGSNYLARIEETSDNLIKGLNRMHDSHL